MKIAWITPNSLVDVDLPIVSELKNEVKIFWQIVVTKISDDIQTYIKSQLKDSANISYVFVEIPYRVYDPRTLVNYCRVLKAAKTFHPDLYYTSFSIAPYSPSLFKWYWPLNKTVAACHNVSTPKGANNERFARYYTDLTLRTFKNIHVFSESQRTILNQRFPNKNILLTPLAIKDYGEPSKRKNGFDGKNVVFLFFGIISPYKRLDLLIRAAQNIYERGYKNFKVKVAGSCKNWDEYRALIKYPNLFETRIERIPNSDVADLFAVCDYFVMPYQDIAQSGAITVAYRYNLPIILSRLPQFSSYVEDGKTGFFFEKENIKDLESKLIQVIEGGEEMHNYLKNGLLDFVQRMYSTSAIAKLYLSYFNTIIQ